MGAYFGTVVDLFCGAGGLSHGFARERFNVLAGIDVDPACKYPYEANNPGRFIRRDVGNLEAGDIVALFGTASKRILAGCAPCQNFSTYSHSNPDRLNGRWDLLEKFASLAIATSPDIVTMENVPALVKDKSFETFVTALECVGFKVNWQIVKCADYGVPQTRRRLVLFASKYGRIKLEPPEPDAEEPTVWEAIGSLTPAPAGSCLIDDPLHSASSLTAINLERIRHSVPGGTWRDWPEHLVAKCHRSESGKTYAGVYGRMSWHRPAPTITTQAYGFGNGRFGHPEQDRAITLREAAILQSFPEDYSFVPRGERIHFTPLGRMIGNAVPVNLARAIAVAIRGHLEVFDA